MNPFFPRTANVNGDRLYFTDGPYFIKMDSNFGRGRHEADILEFMSDAWYAPTLKAVFDKPGFHCLRMTLCPGDTLENIKGTLTLIEKRLVVQALLRIADDLLHRNVVHGDINESNVLFDREKRNVYLIDWETAIMGDGLSDIYGPQWGLLDLLRRIK